MEAEVRTSTVRVCDESGIDGETKKGICRLVSEEDVITLVDIMLKSTLKETFVLLKPSPPPIVPYREIEEPGMVSNSVCSMLSMKILCTGRAYH